MKTLKDQNVLIVGGSRGLGLGAVEALVARDANVTVIARDAARLTDLRARLGVSVIAGDISVDGSAPACGRVLELGISIPAAAPAEVGRDQRI